MTTRKMWALHSWLGAYTGLLLVVLSVSGSLMVFEPQLDRWLNPGLYRVCDTPNAAPHNLQSIYNSLRPTLERLKESGLFKQEMTWILPRNALEPYRLLLPASRSRSLLWREPREFFVDPCSLEIQFRNPRKTFSAFLIDLHFHLLVLGKAGKYFVGLFALALLGTLITGTLIYARFMRKLALGEIRQSSARHRWSDWHKFAGVMTLGFNGVIAITAVWMTWDSILMLPFPSSSSPAQSTSPDPRQQPNASPAASVDSASIDQAGIDQTHIDYARILPTVAQQFPELQVRKLRVGNGKIGVSGSLPGRFYREGTQRLQLHSATLSVLSKRNVAELPLGPRLDSITHAAHHGRFGGLWSKSLYCLFGLLTGALNILGAYLYHSRKRRPAARLVRRYALGTLTVLASLCALTLTWGLRLTQAGVTVLVVLCAVSGLARLLFLFGLRPLARRIRRASTRTP